MKLGVMQIGLAAGLMLFSVPLMTPSAQAEADWSRFRGADGFARAAAAVPITWDDQTHVVWKTNLPGKGTSSPVVWTDHIYLTAYTGYGQEESNPGKPEDLKLHVLAFDRVTGKSLWDTSFAAEHVKPEYNGQVTNHGYATPTPVCDDLGVYAYFGPNGLTAYSHDGKKRWAVSLGTTSKGFGSASSPLLYGDLVIVNASIEGGAMVAVDRRTGKTAWRVENVQSAWTTPVVGKAPDGSDELILSQKGTISGIDPKTGKQLWSCTGVQDYVVPCPVVHDGIAYCLGGRKNQAIAVRLGGRGDVSATHVVWSLNVGANVTSPVVHDGHLYWASDRGIATCIQLADGKEIYRERMPTRTRVYASIILAGQYLYAPMREGGVLVMPAAPRFEITAQNVFKQDNVPIDASPAVTGDRLLLRTNRFLYCIGAQPK